MQRNILSFKDCVGLAKPDRECHVAGQDINPATGKAYAINPQSGVWDDNYFAQNFGGGSGYNANGEAYDKLLQSVPKATEFAQGLNANENAAWDDYMKYIQGQASPLDFYTKQSEIAGLPQLRKTQSTLQGQIYDMEDTLRRIEPDVTATTGNSVVTEAQRRGMVTERQKPLVENLGWLGQSLGRVSSAISEGNQQALNLTQLNEQGNQKFIDAYKEKLNLAMQQGSRALQAFSTDLNNTIDITLKKIARGEAVSDQEQQQAFELLKLQKTADLEAAKPSTEVVEANGRKLLIDKKTGKQIADLGSSKAPGTGTDNATNYQQYYNTNPVPTASAPAGTTMGGYYSTGKGWVKVVQ